MVATPPPNLHFSPRTSHVAFDDGGRAGARGSSYSYKIAFALQMVEKHSAASASSVLPPPAAAPRRPSRPLLMAETAVWVPYASPTHVRATASSTVDADLMVSVDGAGFASANLQDDASCSVARTYRNPEISAIESGIANVEAIRYVDDRVPCMVYLSTKIYLKSRVYVVPCCRKT